MWILTVISVAIGLTSLVITVRRTIADARRQEIWVDLQATQLSPIADPDMGDRVRVLVDGQPVTDPHLVELRLWFSSPRDIRSSDFDPQEPLKIHLNASIRGTVRAPRYFEMNAEDVAWEANGAVKIAPALLKSGAGAELTFISAGKPDLSVISNPVADTRVVMYASEASRTFSGQLRRAFWGMRLMVIGGGLLVSATVATAVLHATESTAIPLLIPCVVLMGAGFIGWFVPFATPTNVGLAVRRAPADFTVDYLATWKSRLRSETS